MDAAAGQDRQRLEGNGQRLSGQKTGTSAFSAARRVGAGGQPRPNRSSLPPLHQPLLCRVPTSLLSVAAALCAERMSAADRPCLFLLTHCMQLLWAAISGFQEGVKLLMECGCNAVAAKAWFTSFDLMQNSSSPKRHSLVELSPGVSIKVKSDTGTRRQAIIPVSSTAAAASQALKLLGFCIEECGDFVHSPMVAQLHMCEPFASPPMSGIKWTSRVRGVSMQVTAASHQHL